MAHHTLLVVCALQEHFLSRVHLTLAPVQTGVQDSAVQGSNSKVGKMDCWPQLSRSVLACFVIVLCCINLGQQIFMSIICSRMSSLLLVPQALE